MMKVLGTSYNLSQNHFQSKILDSGRFFEARFIFSKFMPNFCRLIIQSLLSILKVRKSISRKFYFTVNGQNFELVKILILTYIESVIYL